jgi:hypothetical protein
VLFGFLQHASACGLRCKPATDKSKCLEQTRTLCSIHFDLSVGAVKNYLRFLKNTQINGYEIFTRFEPVAEAS